MTKAEMHTLMIEIFERCQTFRAAGQSEYAHSADDAFANFRRGAAELGLPGVDHKHVLWIYAMKHKDGIAAYLKGHKSQREDVRGRIADLIVYLTLLWGMIDEEEVGADQAEKLIEESNKIVSTLVPTELINQQLDKIADESRT